MCTAGVICMASVPSAHLAGRGVWLRIHVAAQQDRQPGGCVLLWRMAAIAAAAAGPLRLSWIAGIPDAGLAGDASRRLHAALRWPAAFAAAAGSCVRRSLRGQRRNRLLRLCSHCSSFNMGRHSMLCNDIMLAVLSGTTAVQR